MSDDPNSDDRTTSSPAKSDGAQAPGPGKVLSPVARRALQEAEARRRAAKPKDEAAEFGGPSGEEPTRYGDWERGGRAVDF